MIFKLAIWAVASVLIGKVLHAWLSPGELLTSAIVFGSPFVVLGFQDIYRNKHFGIDLFGMSIFRRDTVERQITFWGIPLGDSEIIDDEWEFLDGVSALEFLSIARRFFPAIVNRLLPGNG